MLYFAIFSDKRCQKVVLLFKSALALCGYVVTISQAIALKFIHMIPGTNDHWKQ